MKTKIDVFPKEMKHFGPPRNHDTWHNSQTTILCDRYHCPRASIERVVRAVVVGSADDGAEKSHDSLKR